MPVRTIARAAWTAVAAAVLACTAGAAAQAKLPYKAVDQPTFVAASAAAFLHPQDRLIGVAAGGMAKAYPAAILAQHGVVNDLSPDGPIAITW